MTKVRRVWINGKFVSWPSATIHVLSHAAQRGSLVFDAISVHRTKYGDALFRLPDHIDRFRRSCEITGLALSQSDSEIVYAIRQAVQANPGSRTVKICAYFASVETDVVPNDMRASLALAAYDAQADIKLHPTSQGPSQDTPLRVGIAEGHRSSIVPPQAKVAAAYFAAMIAKARARQSGYDDALQLDDRGNVVEASNANVFVVDRGGHLHTPPASDVLGGVTRSCAIDLARSEGIEVVEAPLRPEALFEAREIFLTATSSGLRSIESVNGRKVGDNHPGPIVIKLNKRLLLARHGEDPEFLHWLTFVEDRRGKAPRTGDVQLI